MKRCDTCHKDKEENMFYEYLSIKGKVLGLQNICKVCNDGFKLVPPYIYLNIRFGMRHLFITSQGIHIYYNKFHKDYPKGKFKLYCLFNTDRRLT
jgi:hypothetical protein